MHDLKLGCVMIDVMIRGSCASSIPNEQSVPMSVTRKFSRAGHKQSKTTFLAFYKKKANDNN